MTQNNNGSWHSACSRPNFGQVGLSQSWNQDAEPCPSVISPASGNAMTRSTEKKCRHHGPAVWLQIPLHQFIKKQKRIKLKEGKTEHKNSIYTLSTCNCSSFSSQELLKSCFDWVCRAFITDFNTITDLLRLFKTPCLTNISGMLSILSEWQTLGSCITCHQLTSTSLYQLLFFPGFGFSKFHSLEKMIKKYYFIFHGSLWFAILTTSK